MSYKLYALDSARRICREANVKTIPEAESLSRNWLADGAEVVRIFMIDSKTGQIIRDWPQD